MKKSATPISASIFKTIYYDKSFTELSLEQRYRFVDEFKESLADMTRLKHDTAYRDFLSQEMGYDFERGFHNLEHTPLLIKKHPHHIGVNYQVNDHIGPSLSLEVHPDFITDETKAKRRTILGHEFGHHLIIASHPDFVFLHDAKNLPPIAGYSDQIRNNWKCELDADKLAIAMHHQNRPSRAMHEGEYWLMEMYHAGFIKHRTAEKLSLFCQERDIKFIKAIERIGAKWTEPGREFLYNALGLFNMSTSKTHPPPITRAVEGDKFAEKVNHYFSNRDQNNPSPT